MRRAAWLACLLLGCTSTPKPASSTERAEELSQACLDDDEPTCMEAAAHYAALPPTQASKARLASLYYRACLRGRTEACHLAGDLYAEGDVAPPDHRRARAIYEHVCRNRFPFDPSACTAGALYGRACDGGAGEACAKLADLHRSGRLGSRRPRIAQQLDARACASGHTASCAAVAKRMADQDPVRAAKLLGVGCHAGDVAQCLALADILHRGAGVPRDLKRAKTLRQSACTGGSAAGCRQLAAMWHRGLGGGFSSARARKLFEKACDGGDADACLHLARAHATGTYGEADMALHYELSGKAAKIYAPACEAGDVHACHVLGALHRAGGGVQEDRALGLSLQERACARGHGRACIAWLRRGPHRISIASKPKLAKAVSSACRRGDGGACFAVGWIGRSDLEAAGANPPAHPYMRGCREGHAGACNAMGVAAFPPAAAAEAALSSSCELGYAPGCHHLGIAMQMRADVEGDEQAVAVYARGCKLGWAPACTRLGMMRRRGHMAPGAMTAKSAFEKACAGSDLAGCFELGMLMRAQGGGDPKVGLSFLEGACKQGHTPSCAEVGTVRLRTSPDQRQMALGELRGACAAGGHRACLVLAEEIDDEDDERKLLDRAVKGGAASCSAGLAVCGGDAPSTSVALAWAPYAGSVARTLEDVPPCGISLERACLVHRDALVKRCALSGDTCFAAGETIRGLAGAGLSVGLGDAKKVEQQGVAWATAACRKRNAAACLALSDAYGKGRGTDEDEEKAGRFAKRACQLDEALCPEEE